MAILSASDLERISSSVAEKSPQNSVAQKRRSLKACSDERVCTWTDTLAAKRKSRLEWKDQKWKKEEEERMEVDRKEAALQENMRQAILENSRRQVFEQNDKVKWLRSHQLYIDVVEERAKQISLSRNIEKDRHQEELKWHKDTMKKVHMAELKESEEAATRKAKSIEIIQEKNGWVVNNLIDDVNCTALSIGEWQNHQHVEARRYDFTQQSRSKTVQSFLQTKYEIMPIVKELVYQEKFKNSVRLLGISFSNLDTEKKDPVWVQLKLEF